MALVAPVVERPVVLAVRSAKGQRIDNAMAVQEAEAAEVGMRVLRVDYDAACIRLTRE